jgi:DNA-binding NtrC family response regulator
MKEGGWTTLTCANIGGLCEELEKGSAFAVVAEEALANGNLPQLMGWIRSQQAWSDFPIIILTRHGDTPDRHSFARRLQDILGNVSFLERPFHPTTLASMARSALRSRRRQYQARELLERYELLARELQHRTKNLLAIISRSATPAWASMARAGKSSLPACTRSPRRRTCSWKATATAPS